MQTVQRTLRIQLRPTPEQATVFLETAGQYAACFNEVAQLGWRERLSNGVELHKRTYQGQRERYALPSQLVCSARVKATESLKSAFALLKKANRENPKRQEQGKKPLNVGQPIMKRPTIRYDARSYGLKLAEGKVSLATVRGRQHLTFKLPVYYRDYATWNTASADLFCDRQGQWWLHVVVAQDVADVQPDGTVVGIDLGIAHPATDSNNTFYGSPNWGAIEQRILALRSRLQSKGTKSAKRHLKKLSGRQKRFRKDCDHVLSKRMVTHQQPGTTIVFENLTDIRTRVSVRKAQRRSLHSWSFAQLQAFVIYKAQSRGVGVGFVDPRYTSQKCNRCGHRERGNRPSQAVFSCKACGHTEHADLNAARNIRDNYIAAFSSSGPTVTRPIVGGPVAESAGTTCKPTDLSVGR